MPLPPSLRALLRTTPTIAPVPHRAVISITGSQSSEFLQGILSTSVTHPPKGPFYSSFLHAQGRVLYDVLVYTQTDGKGQPGFLLEYDSRPSEAPPLLSVLKRYVLRSKVKIRDASVEYDVWSAWGSERESAWETPRQWAWARSGAIEPVWDPASQWPWGNDNLSLRDRRAPGMGARILVRKGDQPPESSTHDTSDSDAYTLHRVLHGVAEGIVDIPPMQAFPMDSNMDVMGGVDFRKGCYVGQELTVRTYHTGVVRKRILPVQLDSHANSSKLEYPVGSDIRPVVRQTPEGPVTPRARGTGKLLTSLNGVGLALLRLEHVEAADAGKIAFEMGTGADDGIKQKVTHWWPDWWPHRPEDPL